jgi:hypothetical protein
MDIAEATVIFRLRTAKQLTAAALPAYQKFQRLCKARLALAVSCMDYNKLSIQ